MATETQPIDVDPVDHKVDEPENDIPLETLILLINSERLKYLQEKSMTELKELKERQLNVSKLHKILKKLNIIAPKGDLNLEDHPELKELIDEAREMGVEIEDGKLNFTEEEKIRLIDNVRMTIEDLNVENEMQLQSVTKYNNERYESWQMAKAIIDPLDKVKKTLARAVRGG